MVELLQSSLMAQIVWDLIFLMFLQLKERHSVHGSDEDVDDHFEADSDEDLSDNTDVHVLEEVHG